MMTALKALLLCSAVLASNDQYQAFMKKGDGFLVQGRSSYKDAVAAYSEGIKVDRSEIKGYLRRAEVYRLLRDHGACVEDLKVVLQKEPRHRKALEMRAKSLIDMGNLQDAAFDYRDLSEVYQAANDHTKSQDALSTANEIHQLAHQLREIEKNKFHYAHECVRVLGVILEKYIKDNIAYRLLRAECAIFIKDHGVAAEEIRRVLVKNPNNVDGLLLNARELRSLGALDHAKQQLKRCLEYDPEFAPCRNLNKAIKLNTKLMDTLRSLTEHKDWKGVVSHVDNMLSEGERNKENPDFEQPPFEDMKLKQCEAHLQLRSVDEGLAACDAVLDARGRESEGTWEAYLFKADLFTVREDLDSAQKELNNAKQYGGRDQHRVQEFEQKLNNLKKQASRKNYYKILGVSKEANTNEIRKAFRTLAFKYHPDKLNDVEESERNRLADLYRDINEAKEVLLDEEKRRKFDNGEDVFANQGGHGGHDPYQNFFHQGGGGFQFHFH
jgi:DnaJ family protein C protein 3